MAMSPRLRRSAMMRPMSLMMLGWMPDRKSTRLNSSHTVIYTLSYTTLFRSVSEVEILFDQEDGHVAAAAQKRDDAADVLDDARLDARSEEHTSELQSHRDLHSFLHDALPICERSRNIVRPGGWPCRRGCAEAR